MYWAFIGQGVAFLCLSIRMPESFIAEVARLVAASLVQGVAENGRVVPAYLLYRAVAAFKIGGVAASAHHGFPQELGDGVFANPEGVDSYGMNRFFPA